MKYQQSPLVDEYIAPFRDDKKERLIWMRQAIQATFPNTIEDISYGIPTYRPAAKRRGLIHFAMTKDHLGLYGVFDTQHDSAVHALIDPYRSGRGTLQFDNANHYQSKQSVAYLRTMHH